MTLLAERLVNANLGTYFAKNYGVQLCNGEFVFFQDSDDLSHPERIRLSMQLLQQPGTVCVRGCYSRVSFPDEKVFPVNGLIQKPGLITLGVRRSVFNDIGFFNCTVKASDDEFYQRIERFYGNTTQPIALLDLPL